MSASYRPFRTPTHNRELLAEPPFSTIPALIDANRRILETDRVSLDGVSLRELRHLARREIFGTETSQPVIVTGHQPELFHPGVWVKNFAACGLAQHLGGVSLNLNVDTDTVKSTEVRLPAWMRWEPDGVKLASVAFVATPGDQTWESLSAADRELESFREHVRSSTANWGYEPLLALASPFMTGETLGERFIAARRHFEQAWGCANVEFAVSQLSRTHAFQHFARHILKDAARFRECYNAAVRGYRVRHKLRSRTHPVPDLAENELPFWQLAGTRREKVTASTAPDRLRPRALTLTLFARLCLTDLFIHGIGGGKYDEVTDAIIRDYFGLEPPAFQVCSATLHLPLPQFDSTKEDVQRAARHLRDLHWNPQRNSYYLMHAHARILESKATDRAGRRRRYRSFRAFGDRHRPTVADQLVLAQANLERTRTEAAANAILQHRDYAWVLYPEEVLRPFLQDVMKRARL